MPLQRCTLIGGAPLSGKSTRARSLAIEQNAVLVATDAVRDWMQALVRTEDRPALFFGRGLSAEELHERFPRPQDMLEAQLAQGEEVQEGVRALLRTRYLPWERVVVEGVVMTPSFMAELTQMLDPVKVDLVVLCHDEGSLRRRLRRRGLWSPSPSTAANLEREFAWVEMFDRLMVKQARTGSIPVEVAREDVMTSSTM